MVLSRTLPQLPDQCEVPPNLVIASDTLRNIYHNALHILDQDRTDQLQIKVHLAAIEHDAVPLLLAVEQLDNQSTEINEWLVTTTTLFGAVFISLSQYGSDIQAQYVNPTQNLVVIVILNCNTRTDHNVHMPQLVTVVHTGQRGRPRKVINLDYLKEATLDSRNIKLTELARVLQIHRNTLRAHMKKHGVERMYSTMSNGELDERIIQFKERRPESGVRYVMGHLRAKGYRVQYRRVQQSLRRVDRIGQVLRTRQIKRRRKYYVKRPNALWHIDGHHKLIRWGIVIHGMIDGFCRTVSSSINYLP